LQSKIHLGQNFTDAVASVASIVATALVLEIGQPNAQYTPPTQLNCRAELRRRCVLNSQLVGDSLDESRRVWTICRQRNRVASCRRCEHSRHQSWPSFQFSAPVTYRLQNC